MVIQQKYADIAVKYTDAKRQNQGVVFDDNYLEFYKSKLRNIAKERNIKEGSKLEAADWNAVFGDIVYLMSDASARVASKDETFRSKVNARNYVLSALNYLFAVTESELGSPDIPAESFKTYFSYWTQSVISAKPTTDISIDDTFNSQRGINAIELQEEIIQPLLRDIQANKNLSQNVGKLYAEYQALVRRQANHGFFWRMFHSAENAARTALIKELEATLKQYAPDLDFTAKAPENPRNVIKSAEQTQAVKGVNAGVGLYELDVPTTFGYAKDVINDRSNHKHSENEQPQIEQNDVSAQPSKLITEGDHDKEKEAIEGNVNKEEAKEANVIEEEVKEEIQEEPVEVIKENSQLADVTEQELLNIINSDDFKKALADTIWDAINSKVDRSVKKEAVTGEIVNKMLDSAATFNETYDEVKTVNENAETINEVIHDSTESIFSDAFNSLDSCNMEITDQVVSAQRLSDIVLNKATVVGFNSAEYSAFANNYAIANETFVHEILEFSRPSLTKTSINAIVSNARKELKVEVKAVSQPSVVENARMEEIKEEPKIEEETHLKADQEDAQTQPEDLNETVNEEEPVAEEDATINDKEEETQQKTEEAEIKAEEEETKAEENKIELADGQNITPVEFTSIYCDWSESTIKTRISSLEDIGAGEDVVDVVLNLSDEKLKVQLVRKAIKLDVNFTQYDFMNLDGELPGEVYVEVAKYGGFYLDNPYFNEHDFDWDEFYSECADLPVDMIKRCIPRIKKFGDSEEVKDAICWIDDTEVADALYDKAIASGVKFSTEQLEEMGRDDRLFLVDDINRIINMPDSEIEELGRAAQEAADNIDNMINHMDQNPKRQKRARFWGILLGIAAGLSKGSKKKRKHDGHCDGDCANCPPHYGYRYGRWYYGHGHNYGCVFGGNKGGGGPD